MDQFDALFGGDRACGQRGPRACDSLVFAQRSSDWRDSLEWRPEFDWTKYAPGQKDFATYLLRTLIARTYRLVGLPPSGARFGRSMFYYRIKLPRAKLRRVKFYRLFRRDPRSSWRSHRCPCDLFVRPVAWAPRRM
jgi:hypothetical protein